MPGSKPGDGPQPTRRQDKPPLRILVFAPAPKDLDSLDAASEVDRIRQALAGRHIQIDRVQGGDRETLIRSLEGLKPDVLHWIGHGVGDADHGGRLLVESRDGGSESVRPEQLTEMLRSGPSLVVLATCESARSDSGDALAAMAPMLARAGIPAVVAMRTAVRDQDAIRFTQTLYASLADGEDVAAENCSSSRRFASKPDSPSQTTGFRVAANVP